MSGYVVTWTLSRCRRFAKEGGGNGPFFGSPRTGFGGLQRRGDVRDGSEQHQRVVLGRKKAPGAPEHGRLVIDGIDDQGAPADQRGAAYAAGERVVEQSGADPPPDPRLIGGKLAEQNARHRVRRLPGADRARQGGGDDGGRRQAVIADDTGRHMDDHDYGEPLLLIGECPGLQPMIERGLAAREVGYVVAGIQQFGRGERRLRHQRFAAPFSHGALRRRDATISGTGAAGVEMAWTNASKPSGVMRSSMLSMRTSSAARTAASRTKSVLDRPRRSAARSMMAMSPSGRRIESGWSLRLVAPVMVVPFAMA